MRILTLDLDRYGPFTGCTLTFRPDARLHIVYGPNEAGKSCSLSGITDLFFGIERQTTYDFLHEGHELRIGATITAQNGSRLAFSRRKGNKNTLLDASNRPLADDALVPFLSGVSRAVFCRAFGLDTVTLRQGAEEMLRSEGELGASLFAAASGLTGLTELRRSLDREADGIFAQRASKDRKFYQALDHYEEARRAIRAHELKAADWKALNHGIDEKAQRHAEVKARQNTNAAERARLSRLKRVVPLVKLIDADLARLDSLGTFPNTPAGFEERLRASLETARKAEDMRERAQRDEARAIQDHADIVLDEALVEKSGDVLGLFSQVGAYVNSRHDSPRIQAEADGFNRRLSEIAVRLGFEDAAAIEISQPTDAAQALVRSLISEGRSLAAELGRHTNTLAKERNVLAQTERQRSERGTPRDPAPLRERLTALGPVLKQLENRTAIERTIQADARNLKEAAERLSPPITDLDALAAVPLPGTETIARFRKDFDALAEEAGREEDRARASSAASIAIEARLRDRANGNPVATAEVIAAKRQQRDGEWSRLRATLFGATDALAGASLAECVTDFERHSSEADRLSDDAAGDAERIAAHTVETSRLAEERSKNGTARQQLLTLQGRKQHLTEAWTAGWAPARIVPLPPSEMGAWRLSVNSLLERREKLGTLRDNLATIDAEVYNIRPALIELTNEAGLPEMQGLEAGLLATRIESQLRAIGESWNAARDLETSIRDTQGRIEELAAAQSEATSRRAEWLQRWKLALAAIGQPATATPDEADAALAAWKDVPPNIRERDNRLRRVAGTQRDIADFETRTAKLVEALVPDLATLPADAAAKALNERLSQAKAAEARRAEAEKRLTEAERNRVEADAESAAADAAVATLAAQLPAGLDLNEFLSRASERNRLLSALTERREQLVAQADGHSEESLRDDLVGFDADATEAELKALEAEEQRLDQEDRQTFADHRDAVNRRTELEQGTGAEVAVQQRRNAEAELAMAAREWTILKLGGLLLGNVIDHHRASQHDPLVARAGVLFKTLTGGAFNGLGQDYDDQDVPRLVGNRQAGEMVPVTGMSDGTRDQLYLALRLAYLEDYASRSEPTPFICDDIFTTFDDARTGHALAALAAVGERVQPIVFTHHRHVVDIARAQMAQGVDIVDLR